MDTLKAPQEMTQIQLALEKESRVVPFRGIVYLFWGLILAKCTLVEWAVQRYAMPFNSLYMWVPTVLFGAVATWVYAGVTLEELRRRPLLGKVASAVWGGCVMSALLLGFVGAGSGGVDPYLLPAVFSVLLGLGYFIHSTLDDRFVYKLAAYGWWFGSLGLFVAPGLHSLAWFALMIVLFQVVPTAYLILADRRADGIVEVG